MLPFEWNEDTVVELDGESIPLSSVPQERRADAVFTITTPSGKVMQLRALRFASDTDAEYIVP